MKNLSKAVIFVLLLVATGTLGACYEPIANTSADEGPGTEPPLADSTPGYSEQDETNAKSTPEDEGMTDQKGPVAGGFRANAESNLKRSGSSLASVADASNPVESRILTEYGAILLSRAKPPSKMMFTSETEVSSFQETAGVSRETVGGTAIELQPAAMEALKKALDEGRDTGLKITPRDGAEAARRSYGKTLDLWNSRFLKACDHWQKKGRLTSEQASRLKSMPIKQQVAEVLELERSGIYFNTFFNNSILYSVAAPGTSQHLSMLALDVSEFADAGVRALLAKHGWFRTVQNDEPHFTFLGLQESELPRYGLKKVNKNGGDYWVPDV